MGKFKDIFKGIDYSVLAHQIIICLVYVAVFSVMVTVFQKCGWSAPNRNEMKALLEEKCGRR